MKIVSDKITPLFRSLFSMGKTPPIPNFTSEPMAVYRSYRRHYVTSHQLADFRRCPLLFQMKRNGLIGDYQSEALLVGRAAHTLTLEGQSAFDAEYAVGGPINGKTGEPYGANTKAFREFSRTQAKTILTDDQYALASHLSHAVKHHAAAAELLTNGLAEAVMRITYRNLKCQIRCDWYNYARGIVDLKTCDNLDNFEADCQTFQYLHQMAFYAFVVYTNCKYFPPVHLIAVEKRDPYRVGVWKIGAKSLHQACRENEGALIALRNCEITNSWPTGYESIRKLGVD